MQQTDDRGPRTGRATDGTAPPRIGALAVELGQAGIAGRGLGFASRTLGADRLLEELRTPLRFGARCRRKAALTADPDERAAWTILAASGPGAVERRLERAGLIHRGPHGRRRQTGPARGGSDEPRRTLHLRGGRAEFGDHATRTPFQEQLAEVALALAEAA